MSSVNKAIIIGNLGSDPEIRTTQSGKPVTNFSVATSEKFNGEERTEWHRVVVWGQAAEHCQRFLKKGSKVYVEGRIQTRSWEKDGQTRYATEIVAAPFGVVFLDKREQSQGSNPSGGYGGGYGSY